MKVYLIPGLGFDDRIFTKLELDNIDCTYLNWIEPREYESIRDYAIRFSNKIESNFDEIYLIGHSMGGIIAQEISVIRPIKKIILISSIKSRQELPMHFKIMKPLRLYKLFSKELTTKTIKFWGKSHDYDTPKDQELVIDMVNKQSNKYLRWALEQLSIWDPIKIQTNTKLIQICGKDDKTFPIKLIEKPNYTLDDAGHFMVYKRSKEISQIIRGELTNRDGK